MEVEENKKVVLVNEFDKEICSITTITLLRLLELSPEAVFLYLFYLKTSKLQNTNQVYANNKFCMTGLGWGKIKFFKAKGKLIETGLIEVKHNRLDSGRITKSYIKIKYIPPNINQCPVERDTGKCIPNSNNGARSPNAKTPQLYTEKGVNQCPDSPDSGPIQTPVAPGLRCDPDSGGTRTPVEQYTNAYYKKLNAYNKKLKGEEIDSKESISLERDDSPDKSYSGTTDVEDSDTNKIFKYWNTKARSLKGILKQEQIVDIHSLSVHTNLESKVWSLSKKLPVGTPTPSISRLIELALEKYSLKELCIAIDNYNTVVLSIARKENIYYHKYIWTNLGEFIYTGLYSNTGFLRFLDLTQIVKQSNFQPTHSYSSPWEIIRRSFKPLTTSKNYTLDNIFDKDSNKYYGFSVDKFEIAKAWFTDVDDLLKDREYKHWKPWSDYWKLELALALCLYKRQKNPEYLEIAKKYFLAWKEMKSSMKEKINELRAGIK